ncbi:MAG: hypothetical protein ACRDBR_00735 [Metamycoplasmataceae bacterium]
MAKKALTNHKITFIGLLCSFVFGLVIGGIVYLMIKIFNLKSWVWYILFAFLPPVIGIIIYATSKAKVVKVY